MTSPPALSYMTIYNSTLSPPEGSFQPGDEDAEEQAHILFYTSRDRAASRDKMLRQVGLAKAISHFSDMFSEDSCNGAHSQARRMVLVSPEPNYWIHACVDLAKAPRMAADATVKVKEPKSSQALDYLDSSVHDISLRSSLLTGYSLFKLKHGSFSSILTSLGREALELQLERHFTPWAWSWDIEEFDDFGRHLGPTLHPLHKTILPLVDEFAEQAISFTCPLLISPPYIIPSSSYTASYSHSILPRYLLDRIGPPVAQTHPSSDSSSKPEANNQSEATAADVEPKPNTTSFLGLPAMNLNLNMNMNATVDARKWNWPGYLTFGKGQNKPNEKGSIDIRSPPDNHPETQQLPDSSLGKDSPSAESDQSHDSALPSNAEVDPEDLADAMSTMSIVLPLEADRERTPTPEPPPEVITLSLHLSPNLDPNSTAHKKLSCLTRDRLSLVLFHPDDESQKIVENTTLLDLAGKVLRAIETVALAHDESHKSSPTAASLLQAKDRSILGTDSYSQSNDEFSSKSEQHYNAQQLQTVHPDITEVFSRTQNPQNFYAARKTTDPAECVYVEVCRKEASLSDVDNILASSLRQFHE